MATHIKEIINSFLQETEKRKNQQKKLKLLVDGFLDDKIKAHIKLKNLLQDEVVFSCSSSSFAYELTLKKKKMLREIKKKFPRIKKIKVELS